ncbi:Galactose-binding domain-like [Trinorchestia longiramus]|nr:Galactose-binding domain-like [Trinorchestia longiramus]
MRRDDCGGEGNCGGEGDCGGGEGDCGGGDGDYGGGDGDYGGGEGDFGGVDDCGGGGEGSDTSYESDNDAACEILNVAAGKAPMQSSVADGGIPQKAVDGSTATAFTAQTCSLTEAEAAPWWYVNLLEPYMVQLVRLDFGQNCCGECCCVHCGLLY